jgi:uncharacterized membrane protein YfbV (UPF0208 family)
MIRKLGIIKIHHDGMATLGKSNNTQLNKEAAALVKEVKKEIKEFEELFHPKKKTN